MTTMTLPQVQYDMIKFQGGLDQDTPTLELKPGFLRDALNFECSIKGGYARIGGYERLDGRAKPSDATYTLIQVLGFTNLPTVGQTLTGGTTGTTGTIIAFSEAENYLIVTLIVGAGFSTAEALTVGATAIGTATPVTFSMTSKLNAQYLNLAADVYRALISAPTGTGTLRGVFSMLNAGVHEVFAFRTSGAAVLLYKATTSGWTLVPYFYEVSFTAGSVAPTEGLTITKGANSATVKRICLESGTWAGGTAAGRFIVTAPTPGNFSAGALTAGATATLSGAQTAITFASGGRFEIILANFGGQLATKRAYGCDKVNRAWEFDGTTLAPIVSGLTVDAPTHIAEHKNHLFLAYGSSIMNSGIGTPFNWTALAGAAEIAVGDTVLGMKVQPGDQTSPVMFVGARDSFYTLYGSSAATPWNLVTFKTQGGAKEYSLQNLDQCYLVNEAGVTDVRVAQEFSNFLGSPLTRHLSTFMQEKRGLLTASCINKDRSQYRLFFSDGSGLYLTIDNGQFVGCIPVQFPNAINCTWTDSLTNGNEVTYLGAVNGTVYQLDKGSSFDGADVEFYLTPNQLNQKSPRVKKAYKKASLSMSGSYYAALNFEYVLGYGSDEYERQAAIEYASNFQGASKWDSGIVWDAFIWDGSTGGPTECEMSGSAENVQPRFSGVSDYIYPFKVESLILHYIPRRGLR